MTPTARVICGMIRLGRRTGYEIKQLVDVSTRFFWAASYGQIYPELRRLEEQGLIRGKDDAASGRARREYELTEKGEEALDGWLRSDEPLTLEMRDEGLLKLFFSGGLAPEERRGGAGVVGAGAGGVPLSPGVDRGGPAREGRRPLRRPPV